MYNNKTTAFKLGLLILLALLLGACAAPSYGPMVEDRSVQARPSERISATSSNTPVKVTDTPAASAPAITPKPQSDVPPTATITITAQPISKPIIAPPINQAAAAPLVQDKVQEKVQEKVKAPTLPASKQAVVEQLLADADQLKAQGKETQAVIQLQRAQRIAPRDPKVYARLAALQLSLGEAARAEQLALKGLTLVPNKKTYQYYFWKLIGASRSHLGDSEGEAKAIVESAKYK
ncbi:hypothetical protein N8265_12280 [Oceanospirillaceae bacterium]|jgi:hypothetical protein|nr:hypothetical protein [Oceanospirillaceae bacterium]MDB9904646.1 hypothetical protein [Oceanospirillaceae bacterium]MDC0084415.1 hypothetical protein [Oceanospirillaceae bacterium]MDC0092181.1 hypothetical protein [Oceanospirillaceae bacterium]MDC1352692.1 hypothetical protein [Oceanospirillaceae bacterium]